MMQQIVITKSSERQGFRVLVMGEGKTQVGHDVMTVDAAIERVRWWINKLEAVRGDDV